MKLDRIAVEKLYPTGVYANIRLRAEASLDDGDDIEWCYKSLQDEVEKAFIAMNPQINWMPATEDSYIGGKDVHPIQPKDERIQSFIATINMCTNLKFLKNFETRVHQENNQELLDAYNKKLSEFL